MAVTDACKRARELRDRALDWLERGATSEMYVSYLGIDPTFGPLRPEPRFRHLLRRVGLDG